MTTVNKPVDIPSCLVNALFKAIPVTTPGREIGKTTNNEITSLPKNLYLLTAKAKQVPKTSAIAVADSPAKMLHLSACLTPVFSNAFDHHMVVK
jgi:hypothetical protein